MGKRRIWDIFGGPQLTNIIAITTGIITIIGIGVGIISIKTTLSLNQEHPIPTTSPQNTIITPIVVIFLSILILMTIINILAQYKNTKRYEIIKILSTLQNKYVLHAQFKTAKDHASQSREKDLKNGNARILTNSLNYDVLYCDEIAENVIKGAIYTYILPCESTVVDEVKNYIEVLYNKMHDKLTLMNSDTPPATINDKVKNILEGKVEFWFFKANIICLYNFARFHQIGDDFFTQSWWYVNPEKRSDTNYMLSQEITGRDDQDQLRTAFDVLKKDSKIKDAYYIYDNREELEKKLIEE